MFIVSALLILLGTVGCLCWAFWHHSARHSNALTRQQHNIAAVKAQLHDLQQANSNQTLTTGDIENYKEEIATQLLADNSATAPAPTLVRIGSTSSSIVIALFMTAAATGLYLLLGSPTHTQAPTAPTNVADVAQMSEKLEQWLQDNPNNGEALVLMAKSLMAQSRYIEAAEYYQRARQVADAPQLLVAHLEALVWADDPQLDEVLAEALQTVADAPLVLWIAGVRAREKGELQAAQNYWQRLYPLLTDSAMQSQVATALSELQSQIAIAGNETDNVTDNEKAITVAVSLAAALPQQLGAEMTVFIFARVAGQKIPVAAKRYTVGQLPIVSVLDDSAAMSPNAKISDNINDGEYQIIARISTSGDARAQAGDWYGETTAKVGARIEIEINKKLDDNSL